MRSLAHDMGIGTRIGHNNNRGTFIKLHSNEVAYIRISILYERAKFLYLTTSTLTALITLSKLKTAIATSVSADAASLDALINAVSPARTSINERLPNWRSRLASSRNSEAIFVCRCKCSVFRRAVCYLNINRDIKFLRKLVKDYGINGAKYRYHTNNIGSSMLGN